MMTADQLEERMADLSDRLNRVGVGADTATMRRLNALLADWQDFYWSEYQQWPVTQLQVWENNLPNMEATLVQLEQTAGSQVQPVTTPRTAPVQTLDPLKVTGTWPLWMKVSAISVLGFALYKVARKVKLL